MSGYDTHTNNLDDEIERMVTTHNAELDLHASLEQAPSTKLVSGAKHKQPNYHKTDAVEVRQIEDMVTSHNTDLGMHNNNRNNNRVDTSVADANLDRQIEDMVTTHNTDDLGMHNNNRNNNRVDTSVVDANLDRQIENMVTTHNTDLGINNNRVDTSTADAELDSLIEDMVTTHNTDLSIGNNHRNNKRVDTSAVDADLDRQIEDMVTTHNTDLGMHNNNRNNNRVDTSVADADLDSLIEDMITTHNTDLSNGNNNRVDTSAVDADLDRQIEDMVTTHNTDLGMHNNKRNNNRVDTSVVDADLNRQIENMVTTHNTDLGINTNRIDTSAADANLDSQIEDMVQQHNSNLGDDLVEGRDYENDEDEWDEVEEDEGNTTQTVSNKVTKYKPNHKTKPSNKTATNPELKPESEADALDESETNNKSVARHDLDEYDSDESSDSDEEVAEPIGTNQKLVADKEKAKYKYVFKEEIDDPNAATLNYTYPKSQSKTKEYLQKNFEGLYSAIAANNTQQKRPGRIPHDGHLVPHSAEHYLRNVLRQRVPPPTTDIKARADDDFVANLLFSHDEAEIIELCENNQAVFKSLQEMGVVSGRPQPGKLLLSQRINYDKEEKSKTPRHVVNNFPRNLFFRIEETRVDDTLIRDRVLPLEEQKKDLDGHVDAFVHRNPLHLAVMEDDATTVNKLLQACSAWRGKASAMHADSDPQQYTNGQVIKRNDRVSRCQYTCNDPKIRPWNHCCFTPERFVWNIPAHDSTSPNDAAVSTKDSGKKPTSKKKKKKTSVKTKAKAEAKVSAQACFVDAKPWRGVETEIENGFYPELFQTDLLDEDTGRSTRQPYQLAFTPLHIAALYNSAGSMKELLRHWLLWRPYNDHLLETNDNHTTSFESKEMLQIFEAESGMSNKMPFPRSGTQFAAPGIQKVNVIDYNFADNPKDYYYEDMKSSKANRDVYTHQDPRFAKQSNTKDKLMDPDQCFYGFKNRKALSKGDGVALKAAMQLQHQRALVARQMSIHRWYQLEAVLFAGCHTIPARAFGQLSMEMKIEPTTSLSDEFRKMRVPYQLSPLQLAAKQNHIKTATVLLHELKYLVLGGEHLQIEAAYRQLFFPNEPQRLKLEARKGKGKALIPPAWKWDKKLAESNPFVHDLLNISPGGKGGLPSVAKQEQMWNNLMQTEYKEMYSRNGDSWDEWDNGKSDAWKNMNEVEAKFMSSLKAARTSDSVPMKGKKKKIEKKFMVRTALDIAVFSAHYDMAEWLVETIVQLRNKESIKFLQSMGYANPNKDLVDILRLSRRVNGAFYNINTKKKFSQDKFNHNADISTNQRRRFDEYIAIAMNSSSLAKFKKATKKLSPPRNEADILRATWW